MHVTCTHLSLCPFFSHQIFFTVINSVVFHSHCMLLMMLIDSHETVARFVREETITKIKTKKRERKKLSESIMRQILSPSLFLSQQLTRYQLSVDQTTVLALSNRRTLFDSTTLILFNVTDVIYLSLYVVSW